MLKIIDELKSKLKEMFKDENTGHDISHLERVYEYALKIQKTEGGDLYVVAVSALVHDIHRVLSNQLKVYVTPEDSLGDVKDILLACNVNFSKLDAILDVVKNHDNKENKDVSIETLIIQDADVLDAVGEIGLKRTLTYCKTHNIPTTSSEPLDCEDYIPNTHPISMCHYVYRTMIPQANELFTKTAKKLVKDELKVLEDFIKNNYTNISV